MTKKNKSEKTKSEKEHQVSLEQALKDCRLAAGLSMEDIALQLNLKVTVIKSIEDNLDKLIEDGTYSVIYLRGYLANYSKAVNLLNLESFTQYQQLSRPKKSVTSLKSSDIINRKKSMSKYILATMCLLVMLVVIVVYVLNNKTESTSIDAEITPKTENAIMRLPSQSENNAVATIKVTSAAIETAVDKKTVDKSTIDKTAVDKAKVETKEKQQTLNEVMPNKGISNESASDKEALPLSEKNNLETLDTTVVTKIPAIIETTVKLKSLNNLIENEVVTEVEHVLHLVFRDECWTEVNDAKGKRLAFNLYKAGSELTLTGTPPFNLKLGKPSGVDVFYQDKLIVKKFKKGETTRFTIAE